MGLGMKNKGLYVSWIKYQRRTKTIIERFGMEEYTLAYEFEKRNAFVKTLATFLKSFLTFTKLMRYQGVVFVQIPSVFLLYTVYFSRLLNSKLFVVIDGHNNLYYESKWSKFPLLPQALAKQDLVLVHNSHVLHHADDRFKTLKNISVAKDLVPKFEHSESKSASFTELALPSEYIFIPCGLGFDEPILEMLEAIKMTPEVNFVITKRAEQLSKFINEPNYDFPSNLIFLGFISEEAFNQVLQHCSSVLVLSTREGTQPSGAIEAMGAKKCLIISDSALTRELFPDFSVFCDNDSESMSKAFLASASKNNTNIDFDTIIKDYEKESLSVISEVLA